MLHRPSVFALLLLAAAFAAAAPRALAIGDDAPAWLRPAAAAAAPTYENKVPAVVLYKERNVTVSDDGRVVTTTTYAVRVLTREGRETARAGAVYLTGSGKVRDLKAWLIRSSGEVKRYGKDQTLDIALADDDVYDEGRVQFISARDDVNTPGDVFGYQSVTEEHTVFTQEGFEFQDELPTLVSRFSLTVPAGWQAAGVVFNHSPVEPTVAGTTYTWEMKNLPFIESEPNAPSMSSLAPRLAVSFYPSGGAGGSMGPSFKTWAEVSRWLSTLHDPQAEPDDAIATKARVLVADCKTDLEKIRAIGRYVQGVHYISIQMGVNRGGGMRPHRAADVFAKNYGDCKDKANLMRAMLRAVKLTAFPVGIYSGDPSYVREEWPSPHQFNHCIIAVKVGDDTDAPTIVKHPALGRLLIFDPTDSTTPVGDLPDYEQGSFALLVAGDDGGLIRMPVTPPEANRLERTAEVTLQSDGSIAASVHDRAQGQAAVHIRRAFNWRSRPDFNKAVERWISAGSTAGAKLSKLEPTDSSAEGRFAVDVDFTAAGYAQSMQDRLLVFKPAVVTHGDSVWLAEPTRKHPVVLESEAFTETVRFKLPAGFDVDELPDAVKLDSEFGTYTASYEVKDGQLVFTRSLVQHAATVPVEKYTAVRTFFGRVRASEQAPVVLARK
ncbi:MAG: DUF3857 and transglutaminase domain-containing protein [Acidobacteriota bacterium]|nr:DUF3857 and transglutaminase domain-containing protein [Acidobacteriota bacterium]